MYAPKCACAKKMTTHIKFYQHKISIFKMYVRKMYVQWKGFNSDKLQILCKNIYEPTKRLQYHIIIIIFILISNSHYRL